jgi:hypothetical protein
MHEAMGSILSTVKPFNQPTDPSVLLIDEIPSAASRSFPSWQYINGVCISLSGILDL